MIDNKEIIKIKVNARYCARELVRVVFAVTENFPKNDPENVKPLLRKKVLGISSFLTHGTAKRNRDEQNNDFLLVMNELRELLKLITIANHLNYCAESSKISVRKSIAQLIDQLDKLVIIGGGFKASK